MSVVEFEQTKRGLLIPMKFDDYGYSPSVGFDTETPDLDDMDITTPLSAQGKDGFIQAIPFTSWSHPLWGMVTFDKTMAQTMKLNYDNGVRGQDLATDYEHGLDPAKGNKASGWVQAMEVRDDGIYWQVKWTDAAAAEIAAGEWRYFSPEWYDDWCNPMNGAEYSYVASGGALTNKPWIKGMLPLNFSEIAALEATIPMQFAVWSTAYQDSLPDSAFMHVESGGKKDASGKTVPRSKRHFPFKDKNGAVDLIHVRNAIARAPQSNLPQAVKDSVQSRGRKLLGGASKGMAEALAEIEVVDESKELEHSEPGSGNAPRQDEDGSDSSDIESGSRRTNDAPLDPSDPGAPHANVPSTEGGTTNMDDFEKSIREKLGIGEDVDVLEHVSGLSSTVAELRTAADAASEVKQFSEQYPAQYAEHQRLLDESRTNSAKAFSESVASMKVFNGDNLVDPTNRVGLSALAIEKLREVHKKFSEGTATIADFEGAVSGIMHGGLLEYGERGSATDTTTTAVNTQTAEGVSNARKQFAELINEVRYADTDKPLSLEQAIREATKRQPDLAAGWRATSAA